MRCKINEKNILPNENIFVTLHRKVLLEIL